MRAIALFLLVSGFAPAQIQQFPEVDQQIEDAVKNGLIPGAVLVVGHNGTVVYRRAYGSRALMPKREPMTLDTIFDAASLTKVIATTPCLMKLVESGKLRIDDPVTNYLPEFQGGKSDITIRLLMTHFSGMPPDLILKPRWSGYDTGIQRALVTVPITPPGARFIYSDINFILLGEIVRRLSGETLPQFAHDAIYAPLGMKDTLFQPPAKLLSRIAPTEIDPDTGEPLRGLVHDPTSRYMGGVAGHAGLFTTGDDLAKYAAMLLGAGEVNGTRVLSGAVVQRFTEPGSPADQPILRGLGWDIDSPYSSNRGDLYHIGSFGHTGYTGTSLWIDPGTNSFVILLTNVVHPHGVKSLSSLRSRVATAIAAAFSQSMPHAVALTGYRETIEGAGIHRTVARTAETLTGLDVLEQRGFADLAGKRVGLITNQTGFDRQGQRNVDLMVAAGIHVTRLFSPEHGLNGKEDAAVANSVDAKTMIPVDSLFAAQDRRISPARLKDVDALVFDIQDAGARFYTYSCTMLYALEDAAKARTPFYVLDRPNPITGTHVEGPVLDHDLESFTGCFDMPLRHGLTLGELATMANAEQHWNADLHVIKMNNWERGDWFDSVSLTWVDLSPNMRSLNAALLYPGIAMLEYNTTYSVGRGTDAPFEQVGAPWIDGPLLAERLNGRFIPGLRVYATRFTPTSSYFSGQTIAGIRFVITDREAFDSTRLGLELAAALRDLFPGHLDFDKCRNLIGSREIIRDLKEGRDASTLWTKAQQQAASFAERSKTYLLY
jgi:uncharacterized protein YbbC (DUF1343 family)/CubicO group peptidase (beta-lactamase class C family)